MRKILIVCSLLYALSGYSQAKWKYGMKKTWTAGFYTETGNVNKITGDSYDNRFAIGLDIGYYVTGGLLVGLDFGFGNTRIHRDGDISLDANQHIRALTGYKFGQWFQLRGAYGLGGQTDYRGCGGGGCSGWSTDQVRSWKASAVIGPVELGYSNNGLVVGIKFIR